MSLEPDRCPFCGRKPSIGRYILNDKPAYDLACTWVLCMVKPVMRAFRDRDNMVRLWNGRYCRRCTSFTAWFMSRLERILRL